MGEAKDQAQGTPPGGEDASPFFDYELTFENTTKNHRSVALTAQFSAPRLRLSEESRGFLEVGFVRCELTAQVENGEFPFEKRRITAPMSMSQEVQHKVRGGTSEEHTANFGMHGEVAGEALATQQKTGLGWGREGKKTESEDHESTFTETWYAIKREGTRSMPIWVIRSRGSRPMDEQIDEKVLGELRKDGSPCKLTTELKADPYDCLIVDSKGLLAASVTKSKLIKAILLERLYIRSVVLSREYGVK